MTSDDPTQGATVAETPHARPQDEQAPADEEKAARIASWRASAERIVVQRVSAPGEPDVVYSAIKGETWFRVGETVRYELAGRLSPAVTTKDAFLQIAGVHGAHATMNVEYGGPGVASLSINARKTLTAMSAELSAEFATFEADAVLEAWMRARNSSTCTASPKPPSMSPTARSARRMWPADRSSACPSPT